MPRNRATERRSIFVAALLILVALTLVPVALAAKGGNSSQTGKGGKSGGDGSLTLVLSTDLNGNGVPNWGDTITYDTSTTATSSPEVSTQCYQNGVLVLHASASFYPGNPFAYMEYVPLKSDAWTSGAADCDAVMYYMNHKKQVTLATLSFHVDA